MTDWQGGSPSEEHGEKVGWAESGVAGGGTGCQRGAGSAGGSQPGNSAGVGPCWEPKSAYKAAVFCRLFLFSFRQSLDLGEHGFPSSPTSWPLILSTLMQENFAAQGRASLLSQGLNGFCFSCSHCSPSEDGKRRASVSQPSLLRVGETLHVR